MHHKWRNESLQPKKDMILYDTDKRVQDRRERGAFLAHLKCLSASVSRMSSEAALVGLMCLELCSNWRMRSSRLRMRIGPGPSGSPVQKKSATSTQILNNG